MISEGKSSRVVQSMLTGWTQIINILHPNIEIYDVDTLFNKIGVGPNADLTNVKATSFIYFELLYEVLPTENGYIFRASYNTQ
jgi:hypothetical protein